MTIRHQTLLMQLLQPLVAEWGVTRTFGEFWRRSPRYTVPTAADQHRESLREETHRLSGNPVDQSDLQPPNMWRNWNRRTERTRPFWKSRRGLIGGIFLPSMGDVREFLSMQGQQPTEMKDRSEAFRQLLPVLQQLPAERLERLANSASHSGPAKLGPLSECYQSNSRRVKAQRGT